MNKGSGVFRTISSSQASQDESAVCDFVKSEGEENEIISSAGNTPNIEEKHDNGNINNMATYIGERLEDKFVSSNVINLSRRNLSEAEISLLSEGLKFIPTPIKICRAKLKKELEEYGRKLRLMWHFRNDEKPFPYEKFRPKSTFNPRKKDTVIETYLSSLEERLLEIDISSKRFNNLTKEESNALYNLRDAPTIIITGADKGSAVVIWDRDNYLKEASMQLEDKDVYKEVQNDPSTLINIIIYALEKIRIRGDLFNDTLNYFLVKDPKFARFYLLPKIHKDLHNVPGRLVISNCGLYTENISSFLDHHLQPIAQKVNSFIKDTNHFLRKIKSLDQLPEGAILCTIDVVGPYPNIRREEGLASLRQFLDVRTEKKVTTETLLELAEIVLKNNIFQFSQKTLKQLRGTATGTKFAPPYAIIFMTDLEESILKDIELQLHIWWRYIDDIFFIWEHGEDSLKQFIETLNASRPTIKFTAEWSKEEINFLDVNIRLKNRQLETDLHIKPTDTHQFLDSTSCHLYHCKKSIPYNQALRYNRISSDNKKLDQCCNDLEKWLMERG